MAGSGGSGHSKVLIVPPPEEGAFRAWRSWSSGLTSGLVGHTSLEQALAEHNPACLLFCGTAELNRVSRTALWGRAICHLGMANELIKNEATADRVSAYLGYRDEPAFYLDHGELEAAFGGVFLSGFRQIMRGMPIRDAYDESLRKWRELAAMLHPQSPPAAAIARMNQKSLLLSGQDSWHLSETPEILTLARGTIQKERRIELLSITPALVNWLNEDPTRLAQLAPDRFEDLIAERLSASGLHVVKTGHTFSKDGGIDLLAYPEKGPVKFLIGVQAKHSRVNRVVGPNVVRDLRGAIQSLPIDVGMIVTNTGFTADAEWVAKQMPTIIRLRGLDHLKTWLRGELAAFAADDLPSIIEVAPGIRVAIPRTFDIP